jgi:hypothetical protein
VLSDDIAAAKTARDDWARFIRKVFAADPLICPPVSVRFGSWRSLKIRAIPMHFHIDPRSS